MTDAGVVRRTAAAAGRGRPAVSVLVPSFGGRGRLGACLGSLAQQSLDRSAFEVVLVLNGPDDGSREVVDRFTGAHRDLCVRVLRLSEPGVANARNVGLAACRGDHVTFLDDDDTLSPRFLESMLAVAEPGVVVAALVGDVVGEAGLGKPDLDTYIGRALGRRVGKTVSADELVTALCYNGAKLVSTHLARSVRYDTGLRSGEDQVYWLGVFAREQFAIRVVDPEQALYLREARAGSVSRQEPSWDFDVTQRLHCLRRLEDLDRSDPVVARAAQHLMRSQAGFVNAYLRAHPQQHAAVVGEAAALDLQEAPWEAVNQGLARDLALCYNFPPDVDTSGMVAAKRLRERGEVVDVVSQQLSGLRARDPRTLELAEEVLGRTLRVTTEPSLRDWWGITPYAEQAWQFVLEQEQAQGPYRSVYSRAMGVGSPFAAALVKLRRPDIEWVAEFSDPLFVGLVGERRLSYVSDDWLSAELAVGMQAAGFEVGERLQVFDWAERISYALADRIVFTNELQMEMMLDQCTDPALVARARQRAEIHAHPRLPERFYHRAEGTLERTEDAVHLAYFGIFYATRDLGVLVEAVARLSWQERRHVRLHVYTSRPDELTLQVVRRGLAGVVTAHRYVPVLEFLNLTTKFDVLVVNDAVTADIHGVNPYLPSKLSDYAGSGAPVWAIFEPGSTMSAMDLDYSSPVADVDAALDVLRSLLTARAAR